MNGARNQFLTGAALAGNEHTASLWSDGLDHVKNFAHFLALADDVVQACKTAKLAAQIPGFLLPFQAFGDFADGAAKLVDQFMILNDVAIRARINGGDGRFDGGNAGNEEEETLGSDFLRELEKIHTALAGHAHIGDDNIENLRFQFALGGRNVVSYFDAMAFLTEGDLKEFANGAFVVDNEN